MQALCLYLVYIADAVVLRLCGLSVHAYATPAGTASNPGRGRCDNAVARVNVIIFNLISVCFLLESIVHTFDPRIGGREAGPNVPVS